MNAFVFLCQFLTSVGTLGNSYVYVDYDLTAMQFFGLALTTFYAIWNLDFFQFFIPSFCISSDMSTLHTLSLDYVVAIYPLLLTAIIYFCIEMYDSSIRVIIQQLKLELGWWFVCGGHSKCALLISEGGGTPRDQ